MRTDLISCTFPVAQVEQMIAADHLFFADFTPIRQRRVHGLPTGHYPMFTRPVELAGLLASLA